MVNKKVNNRKASKQTGKGRIDKYYHLAKQQNFRSRAAYKLIQLDQFSPFLRGSKCIIDLCAAPGSWLQVCSRLCPQATLVGVDLVDIRPIPKVHTIKMDIMSPQLVHVIEKLTPHKANVVLYDGAPSMGSSWTQDAFDQSLLTLKALQVAAKFLDRGGTFVGKVFRSGLSSNLFYLFEQLFSSFKIHKPPASRDTSAETYVVCKGFKGGLSRIDQRFFNADEVFAVQPALSSSLKKLTNIGKKAHRSGYDENAGMFLAKTVNVLDFLKKPPEEVPILLKSINSVNFDTRDLSDQQKDIVKIFLDSPEFIPSEIKALLKDVGIIGRTDMRSLCKWHKKMSAVLTTIENNLNNNENNEEEPEQVDSNDDLSADDTNTNTISNDNDTTIEDEAEIERQNDIKLANELVSLREQREKEAKRKAKKARRKQIKDAHKRNFGINADKKGEATDLLQQDDQELSILSPDVLGKQASGHNATEYVNKINPEDFEVKKLSIRQQKKRAMQRLLQNKPLYDASDSDEDTKPVENDSDSDSEQESLQAITRYLDAYYDTVDPSDRLSESVRQKRTRSTKSGEFVRSTVSLNKTEDTDTLIHQTKTLQGIAPKSMNDFELTSEEEDESEDDMSTLKRRKPNSGVSASTGDGDEGREGSSSSDSSDSDEDELFNQKYANLPTEEKIKILALGQKFMTTEEGREQLKDFNHNRVAFNDPSGLPQWFVQDENIHNRPLIPITKEEMDAIKAKQIEANAILPSKVRQWKARKYKKKFQKKAKISRILMAKIAQREAALNI